MHDASDGAASEAEERCSSRRKRADAASESTVVSDWAMLDCGSRKPAALESTSDSIHSIHCPWFAGMNHDARSLAISCRFFFFFDPPCTEMHVTMQRFLVYDRHVTDGC